MRSWRKICGAAAAALLLGGIGWLLLERAVQTNSAPVGVTDPTAADPHGQTPPAAPESLPAIDPRPFQPESAPAPESRRSPGVHGVIKSRHVVLDPALPPERRAYGVDLEHCEVLAFTISEGGAAHCTTYRFNERTRTVVHPRRDGSFESSLPAGAYRIAIEHRTHDERGAALVEAWYALIDYDGVSDVDLGENWFSDRVVSGVVTDSTGSPRVDTAGRTPVVEYSDTSPHSPADPLSSPGDDVRMNAGADGRFAVSLARFEGPASMVKWRDPMQGKESVYFRRDVTQLDHVFPGDFVPVVLQETGERQHPSGGVALTLDAPPTAVILVHGQSVCVRRELSSEPFARATQYRSVLGLPTGSYLLEAFDETTNSWACDSVEVGSTPVERTWSPDWHDGRVVSGRGNPADVVQRLIDTGNGIERVGQSTVVGSDGWFTLRGLPPTGSLVLRVGAQRRAVPSASGPNYTLPDLAPATSDRR